MTRVASVYCCAILAIFAAGCGKKADPAAEAPPPATVEHVDDVNLIRVDHAEKFALVAAVAHQATSTLNVTGSVNPDVSRTIPVVSLASGRVVDIHARIGDHVQKGQVLMEVESTDISGAFNQYLKAQNDERLARAQFERAKVLFDKGAISRSQYEVADNGEQDAKADLNASQEQLKVLGVDKDHPSEIVKVKAPATGVVIAQNVTSGAAAGVTYAGSSTAFTIADLSHVWIICDVYENDLASVHLGEKADIRLAAFPERVFSGTISDIGAVLDPTIRTAKVRLQVENPGGLMRVGMFATATFHGKRPETYPAVPASAVLHLHDRDWVYVPAGEPGRFRRVSVRAGDMIPGNLEEIQSGLAPGQEVVSNALELEQTVDQ
jgi:cobalt-zinc-cadmium efflux system membrane fusion protein